MLAESLATSSGASSIYSATGQPPAKLDGAGVGQLPADGTPSERNAPNVSHGVVASQLSGAGVTVALQGCEFSGADPSLDSQHNAPSVSPT